MHALPLIWLAPELAKDVLRFTLAQTHPSGEVPYCEDNRLCAHGWSSRVPILFLCRTPGIRRLHVGSLLVDRVLEWMMEFTSH